MGRRRSSSRGATTQKDGASHLADWIGGFRDEQAFSDAQEFFSTLTVTFRRTELNHFVGPGVHGVVFRGLSSPYPNLPRAFRGDDALRHSTFSDFQDLALPPLAQTPSDNDVASFLLWHRMCEVRSVYRFLNYCDQLGIPTPLDYYDTNKIIKEDIRRYDKILQNEAAGRDARDELSEFPEFPPVELREAFAMAQHYGIPTRLIDWSESLRAAMFFAVSRIWRPLIGEHSRRGMRTGTPLCLYALGSELLKKLKWNSFK